LDDFNNFLTFFILIPLLLMAFIILAVIIFGINNILAISVCMVVILAVFLVLVHLTRKYNSVEKSK
jgi:hypothetical protein